MLPITTMPADENVDLVMLARDGCAKSFEKLVRQYHLPLRAFITGKVGDAAIADDLAQEVFLVVLKKFESIRDSRSFQSWLFTIARNKAVDHLRAKASAMETFTGGLEHLLAEPQARLFEDHEQLLTILRECIEKLTPRARNLVQAFYFENQTSESIADAVQSNSGAIRMSLMRIRKALAKCVKTNTGQSNE